ncbi:MAG: hypothetical protein K0R38_374 [Polyangiaceae bacterium]|nr:hypothetical protein [Polyangiaceae bacterium]
MSIRAAVVALACCVATSSPAWASEPAAGRATAGETRTLPGGAVVTFSKDAKYEVGKPIKLQLSATGSDKTPVQVIRLSAGRASVTIPESKKPKTAVLIQAPRKVSAVAKGGQSLVIVAADRVSVAAVKGEMLAALGNDWKPLPSGIVRSHGAGTSTDQAVPAAPKLHVEESLLLALTGTASTKLRAQAQDVAYRKLALSRVDGAKRTPLREQEWRSDAHQLPELEPGRYEVTARAVDRFGVESVASEPLTVRVIGATLPDGARLSEGAILLGRSGRVRLIGAEGLEASYGKASLFIPVPADVGLARGDSTLLRLRAPGAKEELRIRLEPRTLKADVEIGPKSARWPTDPLQVTVKLFDHRGRPITEALKIKPQVFVNVGQVEPTWTHTGNTYTTKVAPAVGMGPWVVRVEVTDDFGDSAGRDFIELGSAATASAQ